MSHEPLKEGNWTLESQRQLASRTSYYVPPVTRLVNVRMEAVRMEAGQPGMAASDGCVEELLQLDASRAGKKSDMPLRGHVVSSLTFSSDSLY